MTGPETYVEREVKLDAGLRFELPELTGILPGVTAVRLPDAKLQATYVDTADLRLMRWGVTLRHRRDAVGGAGAESGWTLKLPAEADGVALVRTELSWPGTFGPVPAEVASLVRAHARGARLLPVAKLLTQRHRVELKDDAGRTLGEVDDDVVSVMDGRRLAARFRQVELEVTDAASDELLDGVMLALTLAGAVAGDDRPKVVRAIGPRASLGPDVVVPELDSRSTVATVVAAAIGAGVTRIIRHDPGVRLGDDPEHVHQARVGTRRLRSDLRTFWSLLDPDWGVPVRAELGWLAAVMGEVRDADVLMGRLRGQIRTLSGVDAKAAAGLLRRLAIQREDARVRLLEALDSDRYVALLENLSQAAAHPPLRRSAPEAATEGKRGDASAPPVVAPFISSGSAGASVGAASETAIRPNGGRDAHPAPVAPLVAVARSPLVLSANLPASQGASRSGPTDNSVSAGGGGADSALAGRRGDAGLAVGPGDARVSEGPAATGVVGGAEEPGLVGRQGDPRVVGGQGDAGLVGEAGLADRRAAEVLPALVKRPWRHLQRAVEHLDDDPPDEALHEIRIRAKRMRYAAEAVAGVIGKPARQLASAVAEVQGVLGDMQDAVVAETWLRSQAASGPPSRALVAGELVTLERQKQAACRREWVRPWKAASKKRLRRWLKR